MTDGEVWEGVSSPFLTKLGSGCELVYSLPRLVRSRALRCLRLTSVLTRLTGLTDGLGSFSESSTASTAPWARRLRRRVAARLSRLDDNGCIWLWEWIGEGVWTSTSGDASCCGELTLLWFKRLALLASKRDCTRYVTGGWELSGVLKRRP